MDKKTALWIISILAVLGFLVSSYLAYVNITGKSVVCFAGEKKDGKSECDVVNQSIYSRTMGIPNGILGMIMYAAVFVVSLFGIKNWHKKIDKEKTLLLIWPILAISVLFSAYLTYIELFVIKAICQWCVVSAVLVVAMFVVCWAALKKGIKSIYLELEDFLFGFFQ